MWGLTVALATKLRGNPDNEYRLEWTEEERVESWFLVVSAVHMEALRRSGMLRLGAFRPTLGLRVLRPHPQPSPCGRGWPRSAGPREGVSTVRLRQRVMELFLPEAWRCPSDYVISEAADRRMERLMSPRKETTWPWSGASLFPSEPTARCVC